MGEVGAGMLESASKYLKSIKLAMTRIHLLSAPSLVLLQSLLCSVRDSRRLQQNELKDYRRSSRKALES